MANNYNRVILMGNLTRDPSLSMTPKDIAVVEFGMATNRVRVNAEGDKKTEVCFIECRAFGRLGENIHRHFHSGKPIFIEGRLTYESWTAKDGTKRSRHRVTVESFQFLQDNSYRSEPEE